MLVHYIFKISPSILRAHQPILYFSLFLLIQMFMVVPTPVERV